jgi:hypothetical protein
MPVGSSEALQTLKAIQQAVEEYEGRVKRVIAAIDAPLQAGATREREGRSDRANGT